TLPVFCSATGRATPLLSTLSLHDALPISALLPRHAQQPVEVVAHHRGLGRHRRHLLELVELVASLRLDLPGHPGLGDPAGQLLRSEEHTSELQSRENLVCRLLLEKKNTPS